MCTHCVLKLLKYGESVLGYMSDVLLLSFFLNVHTFLVFACSKFLSWEWCVTKVRQKKVCVTCWRFWRGYNRTCYFDDKEGEYACRDPGAGACRQVISVGLPAGAKGQRCCIRCYNNLNNLLQQLQKKSKLRDL